MVLGSRRGVHFGGVGASPAVGSYPQGLLLNEFDKLPFVLLQDGYAGLQPGILVEGGVGPLLELDSFRVQLLLVVVEGVGHDPAMFVAAELPTIGLPACIALHEQLVPAAHLTIHLQIFQVDVGNATWLGGVWSHIIPAPSLRPHNDDNIKPALNVRRTGVGTAPPVVL